jgi:hypothetical protein
MEDVLDVYKRSYDETHPLICMDESSKQHIKETRQPIPAKPGTVEKYDTEYERNGVSNMFMFFEPLECPASTILAGLTTITLAGFS